MSAILKRRIRTRPRHAAEDPFKCGVVKFSVYKPSLGGVGSKGAIEALQRAGIPCRPAYSPYVGQEGVEVPKHLAEAAERILYPA